jgi:cation diffusion facilitator CzcD-associated flavoprotein CzcO
MPHGATEVAIVGAGPYGLSVAAHLRAAGVPLRIFGSPMDSWRRRMPAGMCLKSEGFASDLYDSEGALTLGTFSAARGLRYEHVGYPIPLANFVQYGLEFQRRFVPELEQTDVTSLRRSGEGFEIRTATGDICTAARVVLAVGITHFGYVPPSLSGLGSEYVTHTSAHHDMRALRGRRVAVIGAGASAVDVAALMHAAGVEVELLARCGAIAFHSPPQEPRPWLERVLNPRSGLGLGWRSRMCTDAPLLFYRLPLRLRLRAVRNHLGPAPGWFVREQVVGRVPLHLGVGLRKAAVAGGRVHLTYARQGEPESTLVVDHVIAGTGYRVSMGRLRFLDERLRQQLRSVQDAPVLSTSFESSVPGLYLVGLASANNFGPLTRFAFGARFTAQRLSAHLVRQSGLEGATTGRAMS